MKRILFSLALLACTFQVQAQGTFQFSATLTGADEVPPNNDPTVGTATFSLTGNILNFFVYVPAITFITTGGTLNGPASPGNTAPTVFDLGGFVFHSGSSLGDPPFYSSGSPAVGPFGAGPFTLNDNQINELVSGLWYVNITSYDHPDGQLRGQILAVPEPTSFALIFLSCGLIIIRWRKHCSIAFIGLLTCTLLTFQSVWGQPACADCPPNHGSYTLTVSPGWSLMVSAGSNLHSAFARTVI